jgi:hypothetical protein
LRPDDAVQERIGRVEGREDFAREHALVDVHGQCRFAVGAHDACPCRLVEAEARRVLRVDVEHVARPKDRVR